MSDKVEVGVTCGEHPKAMKMDIGRLIETRALVQANSGAGKSYLLRKLLEETHGYAQQIVLDVEGEFSSLREKYDYVLAGKGGDVEAHPKSAELLAHKVLELGVSVIIDLYELKHFERVQFVKIFLDAMMNAPKDLWHQVIVVIDEAHLFVPEKGESAAMSAVIDLGTRGRKRGFACILATQRLSKLHKDVAAECLNKMIGRTSLDIDRKRAADELGFLTAKDSIALRNLAPGQFYVFGPAFTNDVSLIQVGEVSTKHPKAGQRLGHRAPAPTSKVKQILAKLADLPQQAEEEVQDRSALRKRVSELERELRSASKDVKIDKDAVLRAAERIAKGDTTEKSKVIRALFKSFERTISQSLSVLATEVDNSLRKIDLSWGDDKPVVSMKPLEIRLQMPTSRPKKTSDGSVPEKMGKGERLILKFLALRNGRSFSKQQIGAMTGYASGGGSFNTYLSRLRTAGLIADQGGKITLYDLNLAVEILGEEYSAEDRSSLEDWMKRLGGGAKKIYEVLLKNPGSEFTKEELGHAVGMESNGGSFNTYISRLATLGLVDRPSSGIVRLNPELLEI